MFKFLLYSHIIFGGIALFSGLVAAIIKKGSIWHKKMGATFHNAMLISIFISLILASLPGHLNPFLFCIGVFSSYSVIGGKRCLKSIKPNYNIKIDKYLAIAILLIGIAMIGVGFYLKGDVQIILSVFGFFAILSGFNDYKSYQNPDKFKKERIQHHIKKITGGYIAAVTAFIVVNEFFTGLWSWFMPTVIGGIYATYYVILENRKKSK